MLLLGVIWLGVMSWQVVCDGRRATLDAALRLRQAAAEHEFRVGENRAATSENVRFNREILEMRREVFLESMREEKD